MESSPIGKIFGERRRAQGLKMKEIAEKAGITHTKVFRIETGGLRYPSINDLLAIGNVLGISEEEVKHLAGYDDDYDFAHLCSIIPGLQFEQEALIVTSDPYINEMLRDTDPEELEKIADMLRPRKNKKETDKLDF